MLVSIRNACTHQNAHNYSHCCIHSLLDGLSKLTLGISGLLTGTVHLEDHSFGACLR